jgi:hypothetical protein
MVQSNPINFALNSYKARSGYASAERLVNCYAEPNPVTSPFKNSVYGTAGLSTWKDTTNPFGIVAMQVMGDNLYVVIANGNVYAINASKTMTLLGTIPIVITSAIITNNGTQVTILVNGGTAYYCTSSAASLTQITDGDYQLSDSVATLDGYTVFTKQQGRTFQWSTLNNTSAYAALDTQTVEADSSNIVRVAMNNLELWFFKENITEVYYDSARPGYIFDRKEGVFLQKGCAAKLSVSSLDGSFFFLGNDRIVYQTVGYQLSAISTFPISQEIETYSVISDAFGFCYTQGGHKLYCLTFPTEGKTWEYDITTQLWHERTSIGADQQEGRWRANCHAFFAGVNLVGDFQNGKIYQIDENAYTEDGTSILRTAITSTIFQNYGRANINRFILMMDTGTGIATGQGSDPQLMLRSSTDGGKTYSFEQWEPIGASGDYFKEVFWSNLGFGRSFIIQIKMSDPVKFAIVGALVDAQLGDS